MSQLTCMFFRSSSVEQSRSYLGSRFRIKNRETNKKSIAIQWPGFENLTKDSFVESANSVLTPQLGAYQGPKKGLTDGAIMLCKLNKSL